MALVEQIAHHTLKKTALPYASFASPMDEQPGYGTGSRNILLTAKGHIEKRPGFVAVESTPTTFSGNIKQVFTWRRWNSDFFIIANEVTATQSKVYKLRVGVDASFSLIYTSSSPTAFHFVTANNFLFFGNGNDMKKWDSATVTNWGLNVTFSTAVTTGPTSAGAGANWGFLIPTWTNPGNITVSDNTYATVTLNPGEISDSLIGSTFGFAIPTTDTIIGIKVEIEGVATASGTTWYQVYLTKSGVTVGINGAAGQAVPTVEGYTTFGGSSSLWGTTWTPAEVNNSGFGAYVSVRETVGNVSTVSLDHIRITIYSTRPNTPTVATSGSGLTATSGFKYVYCYENANTGHISSPTSASASTGAFTDDQVDVTTTASTDTQVTGQRLFRTTDGGDGNFFGVSGNPYANTTGSKADTTADTALSTATAPISGFNDPPPNANGFAYYANRIWMFVDNKVWCTGWEEISSGVPEESVPSGAAGNFWAFDSEVTGLASLDKGVLVFTAGSIYIITGDSLDTFSRTTVAKGLGCRNQSAIARMGKVCAWLDSSNMVWITDGSQIQEVSFDIRTDIQSIDHASASLAFYANKTFRWLCLMDGGAGLMYVYDMDKEIWMPPWTVGASSICSGETAVGTWDLIIGHSSKKVLKLSASTFTDNSQTYADILVSNVFPMVSDAKPDALGCLDHIALETGTQEPTTVSVLTDDDPDQATFTDITSGKIDALLRAQGSFIKEKWYPVSGSTATAAKRIAMRIDWSASATAWQLYLVDLAYRGVGGRQ